MKTGINLQKKVIGLIAGILFFVIAINTSVLTYTAYNKYKAAMLSKTEAIGEGLQKDLGKVLGLGVPIGSLEGINEKLKELISRDKALGYSMIINSTGTILFHSDERAIGKEVKVETYRNPGASEQVVINKLDNFYNISLPLLDSESKISGYLHIGVKLNAINAQLYSLLFWSAGISILCFFLSLLLVIFFITKFITRPIMDIEKVADRISGGDLSYAIEVKGNDEIASLGNAINRMAFNLKDIILKIGKITNSVFSVTSNIVISSRGVLTSSDVQKHAVEETAKAIEEMNVSISNVASSAEDLFESANDTASSLVEMVASIENIAKNSTIFNESANETASSIEEMAATIKEIAKSLENLSDAGEAVASSIEEVNSSTKGIEERALESVVLAETVMDNASNKGINAAHAAMTGMENIKKDVVSLSDVINMLGRKAQEIGKVLKVIDDVANQTNLLAINAAILASKAGEHGKGFSVVADEIKNLAERTSLLTQEISEVIKSSHDMTRSSIGMASGSIQTVDKGIELVRNVNGALSEIVESSKASTEMAKAIQRATSEESLVIKQITRSVQEMTEQTENISRALHEQSRGSKLIIEATERVREISFQVKVATNEQKENSKYMTSKIENVTRQVGRIVHDTGIQKQRSVEIIRIIEKIRDSAHQLTDSSENMSKVINSLKDEALYLVTELKRFRTN